MGNWISKICPSPRESNLDRYWAILKDYIIKSEDYPDIYSFLDLLRNLRYYDSSESPQDWFSIENEHVVNHWIIFVTCRPQDMDRLSYVARRMNIHVDIIENEPDNEYLPF